MLGDKALELIKQLQRCDYLCPVQDDVIKQVFEEMKALFEENQLDVNASVSGAVQHHTAIQLRHSVLLRDKRCILAYLYNRLMSVRDIRWDFGTVMPPDLQMCLSENEMNWFRSYNRHLANYMMSMGVDLFLHVKPPKSLYVQVRCLRDYGDFETMDGNVIVLAKNSTHFLQRSECEKLIHQGVLEHVTV